MPFGVLVFLSDHHTKKSEKPFSSSPGRNSSTQQSLLLLCKDEPDVTFSETNYQNEPAANSAGSVGKKRKAAQAVPNLSTYNANHRSNRSADSMKNSLNSDTCFEIVEFENVEELNCNVKAELSDNVTGTITELNPENTPAKYTCIVPVSSPIPEMSKLDTENPSHIRLIKVGTVKFLNFGMPEILLFEQHHEKS